MVNNSLNTNMLKSHQDSKKEINSQQKQQIKLKINSTQGKFIEFFLFISFN